MYKNKKSKKHHKKKKFFTLSVITALAFGGIAFGLMHRNDSPPQAPASQQEADNSINFGPPTEGERRAGDEQKHITDEQEKRRNNAELKEADVIISYVGQTDDLIEVNSFVSNVIADGTCTITFRKDDLTVSKKVPAYADASSSICKNPEVPRSEFLSPGDWLVQVTYKSKKAEGTSSTETVDIK